MVLFVLPERPKRNHSVDVMSFDFVTHGMKQQFGTPMTSQSPPTQLNRTSRPDKHTQSVHRKNPLPLPKRREMTPSAPKSMGGSTRQQSAVEHNMPDLLSV